MKSCLIDPETKMRSDRESRLHASRVNLTENESSRHPCPSIAADLACHDRFGGG